jgi:hypothetical protein
LTVVPENTDNSMALVRSNWNLSVDFLRREENRRKRERTNNQLNSHEVPEPRIEPTTHWQRREASYLEDLCFFVIIELIERRAYYRNATHTILYE